MFILGARPSGVGNAWRVEPGQLVYPRLDEALEGWIAKRGQIALSRESGRAGEIGIHEVWVSYREWGASPPPHDVIAPIGGRGGLGRLLIPGVVASRVG